MRIVGLNHYAVRWISTAPKPLVRKFLLGLYESKKFRIIPDNQVSINDINSTRSLPMVEFPKNRIFNEVTMDPKVGNWRKPMTKWYRLGIALLKYYRDGIKNTYVVYRDSKKIMKENNTSTDSELLNKMFQTIEAYEMQMKKTHNTDITIPLSRKQFVEIMRRKEMSKLPNFFIICLIFEEMTALICYFFPQLAPRNCLTPGGYKKISNSKIKNINEAYTKINHDSAYLSPYAMTTSQLFELSRNSPLHVSTITLFTQRLFNVKPKLVTQLNNWYQYLFIDDWLLINNLVRNQELELHKRELVNCIFERKLYKNGEDLNTLALTSEGEMILIERLINYWMKRFEDTIQLNGHKLFTEKWGTLNMTTIYSPEK